MARPQITGLEYTRLDVDFINDRKIRRLRRLTDASAPLVYIQIVCAILKEGYYLKWDDNFVFDIADSLDMDEAYVSKVIDACFEVELLSREMFDQNNIVTSRGIQKQYECSKEKSKSICRVKEYSLLVSSEETQEIEKKPHVASEETSHDEKKPDVSSESIPQIKEKKIKENYYSFSLSPSPGEGAEEEKEKIISFFTFQKNWAAPCAEYEKLVAYNNRPGAKKWSKMSKEEKVSAVTLWQQNPPKTRYDAPFLEMWQKVYRVLIDSGAPKDVRMAALDDEVGWGCDGKELLLRIPAVLSEWIEQYAEQFQSAIWRFVQRNGCNKLKYKEIKHTQSKQLAL